MNCKHYGKCFLRSVLAGLSIGMGGCVFMAMSTGEYKWVGAILFSIGLFTVYTFGFDLYTGKVGYAVENKPPFIIDLLIMIVGNFVGALIIGWMIPMSDAAAAVIVDARLDGDIDWWRVFCKGVFCGVLMFIAADVYKTQKSYLGAFVCVPVFILSGFVIGYAYDDRLRTTMTTGGFIRRRLIRLHPMIVMGALIGFAAFWVQGGVHWDGTHVALSTALLSLLLSLFMIPAFPGSQLDVRGNAEMFPFNGPAWSLFFEYIGNLLYVLFIHRLSTRALGWLAFVTGACLALFSLFDLSGYGMLGVGWTLDGWNFPGGLLRMLFPYTMGMWLARRFRPRRRVKGAFWICSAVLLGLFLVPYIPGKSPVCLNAVFEMV